MWPFSRNNKKELLALFDIVEKSFNSQVDEKIVAINNFIDNFEAECTKKQMKKYHDDIAEIKLSVVRITLGYRNNNKLKINNELKNLRESLSKLKEKIKTIS